MKPGAETKLTRDQARYAERGMRLAIDLAKVAVRQWPTLDERDLVSVGNEAVVRAASRFAPALGVPFEHFARPSVWGAMLDFAHREVLAVQRVSETIRRFFGDEGLADGVVESWLRVGGPERKPRDEAVGSLRARAVELALAAVQAQAEVPTLEETLLREQEERAARERLRLALAELDAADRELVGLYFADACTLDAIAELRGVSKRTIQRALDRIKHHLGASLSRAPAGNLAEHER